jgi:hypothetical protein
VLAFDSLPLPVCLLACLPTLLVGLASTSWDACYSCVPA